MCLLSGNAHVIAQAIIVSVFYRMINDFIQKIMDAHIVSHRGNLCQRFTDAITDVRQSLATFKGTSPASTPPLKDHSAMLYGTIKTGLESSMANLHVCNKN